MGESEAFLRLGAIPSHEEARSSGLLRFLDTIRCAQLFLTSSEDVDAHGSAFAVFISHQWTSFQFPDPSGLQYEAMRKALRSVATRYQVNLLRMYTWVDYCSIPQANSHAQRLAINSLPVYASLLHAFLIVAPPVRHTDLDILCDRVSYQRRGWCRAEQLCHRSRRGAKHMFLADGTGIYSLVEVTRTPRGG